MYHIIKAPLRTEKNTALQNNNNTYVFEVDRRANKKQIAKAVEQLFDVKVMTVRTLINRYRQYKNRQFGQKVKSQSRVHYWKKAFVQLYPGNKIRLFEGA